MSLPRLLLLSGVMPGQAGAGGIYLRTLCRLLPPDRLVCFHLDSRRGPQPGDDPGGFTIECVAAPPETGFGWPGEARWGALRGLAERWIESTRIPPLVDRIVRFAKHHDVDRVWVPLHTPTTIRLARQVAERLGVGLITTVWDPPAYKLAQFGLDSRSSARLLVEFERTLRASRACGVASHAMREKYEQRFGTRCVTMILGAARLPEVTPAARAPGSPFRIGFAGSLYAQAEWTALIEALDRIDWRVAGRDVMISMFSSNLEIRTDRPTRIELLGWHEPDEIVRRFRTFDAAYLPYWFDSDHREVVELAFPGKLAAYVAAGTPVFFHGPRDSSPARFLERYPVGIGCHSLDPGEIATTLERLLTDPGIHANIHGAGDAAYDDELSAEIFRRRFAELIEVPEHRLLPLERPVPATP